MNGFLRGTRAAIALRNRSIRWMTRPPLRYLFAARFGAAGSIVLPEYAAAVPPVTR